MTSKKAVTNEQPQELIIEDPCATLRARYDDLQARYDNLLAEADALKEQSETGRAGFMVTTPNAQYNGMTAGVQFRQGRAFIPAGEEGQKLADYLAAEFGYSVQYVTDWQAAPEGEAIGKSLIDTVMLPHRR